jgi:adenosylcobinamide-phosphate synthase
MGKLIGFLDKRLRAGTAAQWKERLKGACLACIVIGISVLSAYLLIRFFSELNHFLGKVIRVYLGYTAISVKDLFVHAQGIQQKLSVYSLPDARRRLSWIVGRDTKDLSEEKIIKATVESIAESTSDGIIAPLFYLILGGPVLAIGYKAVSTLDSMVGYKNAKYMHFGWFSARLDDVVNFVPACLTGALMPVASFLTGHGFVNSLRIMLRDGRKHLSSNSGISEAAMAGALGVQLGGPSTYQGVICAKPYLGDEKMPISPSIISRAIRISFVTSLLMVLIGAALKCAR